MKNKNLIIVGKKSFLGTNIFKSLKIKKKIILSYNEFCKLDDNTISKFNYICNCAVKKNYKNKKYSTRNDIDVLISQRITKFNIKYIFLSSRKVYQPKYNLNENDLTKPIDHYSKNKVITENYLKKNLKNNVLILRISNIIGLKLKKNYRKINDTFFDNYLKLLKKNKKIIFNNFFKDFISIDQFTKTFSLILKYDLKGIYNLSLGKKIYLSEIIGWLNSSNKNRENFKPSKKILNIDSFTLNNNKLYKKINYKPKKIDLKKFCLRLSKKIH